MNEFIFVVEDDSKALYYIERILKKNGYLVETAKDGQEALDKLQASKIIPDLIISDIMMPKIDGYNFFKAVSEIPKLANITFIFLSALNTSEDIRFGKLLGVDDYLTKPIEAKDLLAILAGKLARNKLIKYLNNKINENNIDNLIEPISTLQEHDIWLFTVFWDDIFGPLLEESYSTGEECSFSIEKIGAQLYRAAIPIFGEKAEKKAEGILLNVNNIQNKGYLFFDAYPDKSFRGGKRDYMIAVISPVISYRNSLALRQILSKISEEIKQKKEFELQSYWKEVVKILLKNL